MRCLVLSMCVTATLALTGCGDDEKAVDTPNTTASPTHEARITDLEKYKESSQRRWAAQTQYDEQEPDRILETIKDRLNRTSPSSVAVCIETSTPTPATLTSLGTQPTVKGRLGGPANIGAVSPRLFVLPAPPTATAPPGAASYDLPPHLAAYVKERFDQSDAKQTEILGKEDTIIGKLDEIATAVKGLTDKVTKIEQRLPAPNSPVRPKPEVPQPE